MRNNITLAINEESTACGTCKEEKTEIQRVGGSEIDNKNILMPTFNRVCQNKKCVCYINVENIDTWVIVGSTKYANLRKLRRSGEGHRERTEKVCIDRPHSNNAKQRNSKQRRLQNKRDSSLYIRNYKPRG